MAPTSALPSRAHPDPLPCGCPPPAVRTGIVSRLLADSEHRRGTPARSTWLSGKDSTLEGDEMGETLALPVLPLDDVVVLPGMVVPIRISGADASAEARAAVDAAASSVTAGNHQVLLVP